MLMVLLPLSPLYHHHHHQYGSEKERENGQEINGVDQRIYLHQMRVYCTNIHGLQALKMVKMHLISSHAMKVSFIMLGLGMVPMFLKSMTTVVGLTTRNGTGMSIGEQILGSHMTVIRIAVDSVQIVIGTEMNSMSNVREGLTKIVSEGTSWEGERAAPVSRKENDSATVLQIFQCLGRGQVQLQVLESKKIQARY
jgi:hypothetical protein